MQRRELRGNKILLGPAISEPCLRSNWEPFRDPVQARIPERATASHFQIRHKGIPVRNAAPPRIGVLADAKQTKRRGQKRRGGLAVGPKGLPSRINSASNLPGPQLMRTFRTVASSVLRRSANGLTVGADAMIAPTFRLRFGHPSRRFPMLPGGIAEVEND